MSSIEFKSRDELVSSQPPAPVRMDISALRAKLDNSNGPAFWRSLEEASGTPEFKEFLHAEFPSRAEPTEVDRREFIKLMGASMALAGLTACTKQPPEKIIPYVTQPEDLVPGKPMFFATSIPMGSFARGILVESHMGRPTKIEGNEKHPDSLGSTDSGMQAAILDLYDPDRSRTYIKNGRLSTREIVMNQLDSLLLSAGDGSGLRFVIGPVSSPSLTALLNEIVVKYPKTKFTVHDPLESSVHAATEQVYGKKFNLVHHLDKADVILAVDADFLVSGPGGLRHARDFAQKRNAVEGNHPSRLYAVESSPTVSGMAADHRLPLRRAEIPGFILQLAKAVGASAVAGETGELSGDAVKFAAIVARDLKSHEGRSVVIGGQSLPADIQAAICAINEALKNRGETVTLSAPKVLLEGPNFQSLKELTAEMAANTVQTLVVWGTNPVYSAPGELEFSQYFQQVVTRVHLGNYLDETARLSHLHIPATHFLEDWGDAVAFDGTVSLIQPLIAPLYAGLQSAYAFFGKFAGKAELDAYSYVQAIWKSSWGEEGFDAMWKTALHDGVVADSHERADRRTFRGTVQVASIAPGGPDTYEVTFSASSTIGDGSRANNSWLQELPDPVTKVTWDNVAVVSPTDAEVFHVVNGDEIELALGGRSIRLPVLVQPGQAKGSIGVSMGYGRTAAGRVGTNVGSSVYPLRPSVNPWCVQGATVSATGVAHKLAITQHHHSMDDGLQNRKLVRMGTFDQYAKNPGFAHDGHHKFAEDMTFYDGKDHDYTKGNRWAMVINLTNCVGCGACVTACQAENNIPVVGKDQVGRGREMQWIRIDRYYQGPLDNPVSVSQPIPCMQCENAPCEVVCPVGATVHSAEGLNDMVYNRCVGTRYCSNNCPYKVRRFNFYSFTDQTPELKLQRNPDVTVRYRGVMEKCTYCVQRINLARIDARREDRPIRDGEVITACQQACPTQAIIFGNLNDPESKVSKYKASKLNYTLLDELITKPRTSYIARLNNLNGALVAEATTESDAHGHH